MTMNLIARTLRAKKLGVLLRDARQSAGKSMADCAQTIGVSEQAIEAYELGENSPSLPELELLAYHLDLPLEQFWGGVTISKREPGKSELDVERIISLRQRKIGALLRQARLQSRRSLEDLAGLIGQTAAQLEAYEMGEDPIPLPELEAICGVLGRSPREFQDRHGPVGAWVEQQRAVKDYMTLPQELKAFVSKPVNRPYLELAQRLSEMSVEKLRSVAEGLLEITL